MTQNKELDHLRNLIEILVMNAFGDKHYFKNNAIRALTREILLKKGDFSSNLASLDNVTWRWSFFHIRFDIFI